MRWQGALRENTLQHQRECVCESVWAYETYQGPVNSTKAMEVPRLAIQRREKHGNYQQQHQQQQPSTKPVGTRNIAGSKQDVERSISSFFLSSSPCFFVFNPGSEKRAGQDATWTL